MIKDKGNLENTLREQPKAKRNQEVTKLRAELKKTDLVIKRISISSPGVIELIGSLTPLLVLTSVYKIYIEHKQWKSEQLMRKEEHELKMELMQLEIVEKKIGLLDNAGIDELQKKNLLIHSLALPTQNLIQKSNEMNARLLDNL